MDDLHQLLETRCRPGDRKWRSTYATDVVLQLLVAIRSLLFHESETRCRASARSEWRHPHGCDHAFDDEIKFLSADVLVERVGAAGRKPPKSRAENPAFGPLQKIRLGILITLEGRQLRSSGLIKKYPSMGFMLRCRCAWPYRCSLRNGALVLLRLRNSRRARASNPHD
jgi:hypothetical protein